MLQRLKTCLLQCKYQVPWYLSGTAMWLKSKKNVFLKVKKWRWDWNWVMKREKWSCCVWPFAPVFSPCKCLSGIIVIIANKRMCTACHTAAVPPCTLHTQKHFSASNFLFIVGWWYTWNRLSKSLKYLSDLPKHACCALQKLSLDISSSSYSWLKMLYFNCQQCS